MLLVGNMARELRFSSKVLARKLHNQAMTVFEDYEPS